MVLVGPILKTLANTHVEPPSLARPCAPRPTMFQDANKREALRTRTHGFTALQGGRRRGVLPGGGVSGGREQPDQGRRVRRVRLVPEPGAEGHRKQ